MTDMTTAAGYAWFREQYEELMEAYCITLVQGLAPEELLGALGVRSASRIAGVAGLGEPSYRLGRHDELFVGAASLGGWSLMVEYNGYLGVTDEAMPPSSRGRTVVSHFRNVNAVDHFCWYQDGAVRLHFEPLFPYQRDGTHPDELVTVMRESGFELSDADDRAFDEHNEAAFALAHRITGVRLAPELLASAEFVCGLAPVPRT
ncbi:DUF6461 domain-containing protein [Actinacidiphila glaucinigra]|uniref:DUF6461 domain-containing protein n=1 Tax=Actinacidiphila glaucinigra TaxID=235986 RepID=UPI0038678589